MVRLDGVASSLLADCKNCQYAHLPERPSSVSSDPESHPKVGFESVSGFGFRRLKPTFAVGFGFRVSSLATVSGFGFRVSGFVD